LLSVIDGKDHMLWNFLTASKRAPISVLEFFFTMLECDGVTIQGIHVDKDDTLANSSEFCDFLLECKMPLETTGGYASFLNGKIE
jgi:hypothetical protein